jgi:hypothetical protein
LAPLGWGAGKASHAQQAMAPGLQGGHGGHGCGAAGEDVVYQQQGLQARARGSSADEHPLQIGLALGFI